MQEISFLMSTKTTQMTDKIGFKDTSHPWEKMFFLCSYLIENNSNNWQAQVQEQIPSPKTNKKNGKREFILWPASKIFRNKNIFNQGDP